MVITLQSLRIINLQAIMVEGYPLVKVIGTVQKTCLFAVLL